MESILIPAALALALAAFRELNVRHRRELSMVDIARQINPLLRSWIEYYGRYALSALSPLLRYVNQTLRACVMRKFKRAFYPLPCETELSLMITPGISLNGKQRSGLSWRRALIGILGSRASPGSCTIARPPACSIAMSPCVPSLPPPVSMIPITREPYMLAADRKSGSAAGLV